MVEFPCPKSKTIYECSAFSDEKSRHLFSITEHFFNHAVEIFLPCCDSFPDTIKTNSPDQQDYYLVRKLPLLELTKAEFIQKFIKTAQLQNIPPLPFRVSLGGLRGFGGLFYKGKYGLRTSRKTTKHAQGRLYGLSIGQNIDTYNVAAILPVGKLVLSVNKDTYQELGLEGKPSQFDKPRKITRYFVEVNLLADSFHPGKKNYERVQWCFKGRLDLTFDFLLAWQPEDAAQNLDSLCRFWNNRYECRRLQQRCETFVLQNVDIPVLDGSHMKMNPRKHSSGYPSANGTSRSDEDYQTRSCEASEVYEWLGAVSCKCNRSGKADDFVSTYICPEPEQQVSHAVCHRWTGFITSERIVQLLEALRQHIQQGRAPWAALTVHGFADTPVSWGTREHGYHKFGDNLYTFIVFPEGQRYWLVTSIGSRDICP